MTFNRDCITISLPSRPAPQRYFPVDLIQFDAMRRVLYTCADGDIRTIASIDRLTDSVYDLIADGRQVQLEIGLREDVGRHSVLMLIE